MENMNNLFKTNNYGNDKFNSIFFSYDVNKYEYKSVLCGNERIEQAKYIIEKDKKILDE